MLGAGNVVNGQRLAQPANFYCNTSETNRSHRAAGTMFTFCPLQGALSDSSASQSLLELDGGVKVLVDVGWDESFDVSKLEELEKCVY